MPTGVYVRKRKPVEARFWAKVDVRGPDECWEWQGARTRDGYGSFGITTDHVVLAHRQALELTRGPIPPGLFVCHRCDNPPCCNPAHLFWGTALDNARDRADRRRRTAPSGEQHAMHKLTDSEVAAIREAYGPALGRGRRGGVTQSQLARRFGVDQTTVSSIVRGRHRASSSH